MIRTKLSRYLMAFSSLLCLELAMIPNFLTTTQVQAQPSTNTTTPPRRNRVTFQPRKDQPAPTMTVGGGTRSSGKCPQDSKMTQQASASKNQEQYLTPLLPPSNKLQLTVSANPTVLVYVPRTSAKAVNFYLLADNGEKEIYHTTMQLTGTPGIVRITVPFSTVALEIGKDYRWILEMDCQAGTDDSITQENPFTEGLVRRIKAETSLSPVDDKAKSLEQVALYANSGVWYEALADLAALRKARPNDPEVASAWQDLLQDAGLESIANAPLNN